MEFLHNMGPLFVGGFISGIPISIIFSSLFGLKKVAPIIMWTTFCGIALIIIK